MVLAMESETRGWGQKPDHVNRYSRNRNRISSSCDINEETMGQKYYETWDKGNQCIGLVYKRLRGEKRRELPKSTLIICGTGGSHRL